MPEQILFNEEARAELLRGVASLLLTTEVLVIDMPDDAGGPPDRSAT